MDTRPNLNAPFAVLRVDKRKAKAMGAIAAASAHHLRQRPTPNANPKGPAPIILHLSAGTTPYQAASHLLEDAERRNKDTVLCREVVLSASPGYFRPGREAIGGAFDPDRTKAWARISLAWAKRQWPDQLAAAVLHLDEQTPHIHLLVVPRVAKPEGSWKLNSKALFDRASLRELQTAYGEAVAPLGIQRGLAGSMASHTSVKQFYGAVIAKKPPMPSLNLPKPPKKPEGSTGTRALLDGIATAIGIKTAHDEQVSKYEEDYRAWQAEIREAKQTRRLAWEDLQRRADYSNLANRKHDHSGRSSPLENTHSPRADRIQPKATAPSKGPRMR
jgi:hypothetical protein